MKITDSLFLQRHGEKIEAALGCYDRLVITGTLLDVAYPAAVQHRLNERDLRCFELRGNLYGLLRQLPLSAGGHMAPDSYSQSSRNQCKRRADSGQASRGRHDRRHVDGQLRHEILPRILDDWIVPRLELQNQRCTGNLVIPVRLWNL